MPGIAEQGEERLYETRSDFRVSGELIQLEFNGVGQGAGRYGAGCALGLRAAIA